MRTETLFVRKIPGGDSGSLWLSKKNIDEGGVLVLGVIAECFFKKNPHPKLFSSFIAGKSGCV